MIRMPKCGSSRSAAKPLSVVTRRACSRSTVCQTSPSSAPCSAVPVRHHPHDLIDGNPRPDEASLPMANPGIDVNMRVHSVNLRSTKQYHLDHRKCSRMRIALASNKKLGPAPWSCPRRRAEGRRPDSPRDLAAGHLPSHAPLPIRDCVAVWLPLPRNGTAVPGKGSGVRVKPYR
jgi:hypothetical protein